MRTTLKLAAVVAALGLFVAACGGDAEETTTTTAPAALMDIVDTAVAAGSFTTLVTAVQAAGLVDTLKGEGPFTVFAPTDAAFAALPEGTLESLLADIPALTDILLYHVVPGKVMSSAVPGLDGVAVTTVGGGTFTIAVKDDKIKLRDNDTDASNPRLILDMLDIPAGNSVIHAINRVLRPIDLP